MLGLGPISSAPISASVNNANVVPPAGSLIVQTFGSLQTLVFNTFFTNNPTRNVGSFTTHNPTIAQSASVFIIPQTGALSFVGYAATVSSSGGSGSTITPGAGSLSFVGFGSTFNLGIKPAAGSLTLAGLASSMDLKFTPATGTLVLTGFAPSVTASGGGGSTITPGVGALTVSGLGLSMDLRFTPATGALAFAGFGSRLGLGITPQTGAITLSGLGSSLDLKLTPGVGALAIAGFGASMDLKLTPSAGQLTFTGIASSTRQSAFITPATGSISIVGYVPLLPGANSVTIIPGAGSMIITGNGAPPQFELTKSMFMADVMSTDLTASSDGVIWGVTISKDTWDSPNLSTFWLSQGDWLIDP